MSKAAEYLNTLPAPVAPPQAASTFFFDGQPMTVLNRHGEPWFAAGEVASVMGYRAAPELTRLLKEREKGTHTVRTLGGEQAISVISEPGLYRVIMLRRSSTRHPADVFERIERFQDWVLHEVLPSIRRTGSYAVPGAPAPVSGAAMLEIMRDPHALIALAAHHAQGRIVAEQRAEVAEATIEEQRPMMDAYLTLLDDDGLCTLSTAARAIDAPQGLFFEWLRERGYCFDREGFLQPRADLRKDGHLKVKLGPAEYGRRRPQTMVTRSGLVWLRHRWISGPGKVLALQAAVAARQGKLPGV